MWAPMISLFVFPNHGTEVQMSNLRFEELIEDDECPGKDGNLSEHVAKCPLQYLYKPSTPTSRAGPCHLPALTSLLSWML